MTLHSRRNAVLEPFRYDLPEHVRSRILCTIEQLIARHCQNLDFGDMLLELGDELVAQYGFLNRSAYVAARRSNNPVIEHFYCSADEQALDFIQLAFETYQNCGGQPTVDAINRIFEEEGIGYELTAIREIPVPSKRRVGKEFRTETPRIIRKDERLLHQETIQPCLEALGDSRFDTANRELMNAFEELRRGAYADAITSAGSAFESVLKTICALKSWQTTRIRTPPACYWTSAGKTDCSRRFTNRSSRAQRPSATKCAMPTGAARLRNTCQPGSWPSICSISRQPTSCC
jgi:hypothetical protein